MTALLEAQNLSVSFRAPGRGLFSSGRRVRILEDTSLTIGIGETIGVVGESGSAKTTLARALLGLTPISSGSVRLRGETLTSATTRRLRRDTAMLFQDPVASLSPRMTVGAQVIEPFIIHGVAIADPRAKAAELLALVGLPVEMADRYPHELSGGQARRVGVARALALKPDLLVADEPTAGLDMSIQGDILNLLMSLRASLGLSCLIITHNLAMIRHVADRLVVLYLGRIVEEGPTADVFSAPRHPYTRSLIESEPIPDPRRRHHAAPLQGDIPSIMARPSGCAFHPRCPIAQDRCRDEAPELSRDPDGRQTRCHFPLLLQPGGRP